MTTTQPTPPNTVEALSNPRRRYALVALGQRDGSASRDELAGDVEAFERCGSPEDPPDPDRIRLALHHVHLPKLDAAGLVEFDPDSGRVTLDGEVPTDRVAVPGGDADDHHPDADRVLSVLASDRRRTALRATVDGWMPVADLATRIAAVETGRPPADVDEEYRDRVLVSLVHNHLPALADAGLVEYDPAERTVAPEPRAARALELAGAGRSDLGGGPVTWSQSRAD